MTELTPAEIDNLCRRAADYSHTWDYPTPPPSSILDFYLIDMFRNFYNTGLRFYELADPTRWSKNAADNYQCNTLKGSDPRVFSPIELSDYFIFCLEDNIDPYPMCRYTTAVRYLTKVLLPLHISHEDGGISMHIFRHNKVKQMTRDLFTIQEISDYLGEVDNRNTTIYKESSLYKSF